MYYLKIDRNKYSLYVCCFRDKPDDLLVEMSDYSEVHNLKIKNKFNPLIVPDILR